MPNVNYIVTHANGNTATILAASFMTTTGQRHLGVPRGAHTGINDAEEGVTVVFQRQIPNPAYDPTRAGPDYWEEPMRHQEAGLFTGVVQVRMESDVNPEVSNDF